MNGSMPRPKNLSMKMDFRSDTIIMDYLNKYGFVT